MVGFMKTAAVAMALAGGAMGKVGAMGKAHKAATADTQSASPQKAAAYSTMQDATGLEYVFMDFTKEDGSYNVVKGKVSEDCKAVLAAGEGKGVILPSLEDTWYLAMSKACPGVEFEATATLYYDNEKIDPGCGGIDHTVAVDPPTIKGVSRVKDSQATITYLGVNCVEAGGPSGFWQSTKDYTACNNPVKIADIGSVTWSGPDPTTLAKVTVRTKKNWEWREVVADFSKCDVDAARPGTTFTEVVRFKGAAHNLALGALAAAALTAAALF